MHIGVLSFELMDTFNFMDQVFDPNLKYMTKLFIFL